MEVQTTHGKLKLPSEYKRKWFVLFSHPADFTPVCTTEFYSFAKNYKKFQDFNCELIGLSIDQVFSHIKWIQWIEENLEIKIPFPIIADHGQVARVLGMIHPNKGLNTVRAIFIVDSNGIIRLINYYPKQIGRLIDEILRVVEALKTADEEKVVIPANWPKNELIGRQVIIPPATDEKSAEERVKEYSNYDWWFCYKSLEYEK